ncbi:hypothetical protein B0T17DRAFT_110389 [Bombardia bombarda]|uniref:Uncharacterized protein n=1 Tax=Bombardia bombarda TaxID=252184 RepID=A0AA39XNU3_9PEZI|nr:hypothetical protein B0T17DRAFT_110389 [Bombardia bombarda]
MCILDFYRFTSTDLLYLFIFPILLFSCAVIYHQNYTAKPSSHMDESRFLPVFRIQLFFILILPLRVHVV